MATGNFDRSLRPRWKVERNRIRRRIGAAVVVLVAVVSVFAFIGF